MWRPISDDESTDSESSSAARAGAVSGGSCSEFLRSDPSEKPRRGRKPSGGAPLPRTRRRRAGSGRPADVCSSQEYLSAQSTTGDTTPHESPSSRPITFTSPTQTTTTTTTMSSRPHQDVSPGASLAVQGPSRDLEDVALSLSDELSGTAAAPTRRLPEFTPRRRDKRASVPPETPESPQIRMFKGKRHGVRDPPPVVPLKRTDRTREGDLPLYVKLQKSISEGNLLLAPPPRQKRRWKPRESVPLALTRKPGVVAVAADKAPLLRQPFDTEKTTETSPDAALPASFAVQHSGLDDDKKSVHTTRGHSSSPRTTTTQSHPTTTSDQRESTSGRAFEGDTAASSSGQKPVPAERSSKWEKRAPAADLQLYPTGISGDRTPDGSSLEKNVPPKELFAHWEKVFGKEGLETTANQSDNDSNEDHVSPQDVSSVKRVAAAEKLDNRRTVKPKSVPLKAEAGPAHEGAPKARKRTKKSSPKESPNLKRTTAMDDLTHGAQPMDATGAQARGGELVDLSPATQLQAPGKHGVSPRDADGWADLRKGKKEAVRKRDMPRSSHPAPSSPTYKYYLSRSWSRSSDKRGPDGSSSEMSTHGLDLYKGCLHAGKVLSPTRRTPEMTSLVSSLPIVEEKESKKELPEDQLPPVVPHKPPVPKGRKVSPPKPVAVKEAKPAMDLLKKDVEDVSPPKAVEPIPKPSKVALTPKSETALLKPVSELAVDEKKYAGGVESLKKSSLLPPLVPYAPGEIAPKSDSSMRIAAVPGDSVKRLEEPREEDKTEKSLKTEEGELPTLPIEYPPTGSESQEEDDGAAALPKSAEPREVTEKKEAVPTVPHAPPAPQIEQMNAPEETRGDVKLLEVEELGERSTPPEKEGEDLPFEKTAESKKAQERESQEKESAHTEIPADEAALAEGEEAPRSKIETSIPTHEAALTEGEEAPRSKIEASTPTHEAALAEGEEAARSKIEATTSTKRSESGAEDQLLAVGPEDEALPVVESEHLAASRISEHPVVAETEPSRSEKSGAASVQEGGEASGEKTAVPPEGAEEEGPAEEEAEGGATTLKAETTQPEVEEEAPKEEEDQWPLPPAEPEQQQQQIREPEVKVEVAFLKPKGNEPYYVALVQIRTIPMLLLIGNIVVLIILLIASYFDLFVLFYVGPGVLPVAPASTKGLGLVCRTIRCGIGGTTLYYAINHNVQPCDSMFQYMCERWIHEPSGKYQAVVLGAEKSVIDDMYAEMRKVVESYHAYAKSGHALGKLATLYKSCQDTHERDKQGAGPLTQLRRQYTLHEWPFKERFSGKPEEAVAQYIRDTGSGVFVSVRMIPDPDDPQQHAAKLIALECSTFVLPIDMLLTYRSTQKEAIKAYKSYISSNLEDFHPGSPEKLVSNIFAFEVNLAHRCNVQCRRKRLKKVKVSELSSDSGINWTRFLKTVMGNVRYNVGPDTPILVRSVSYFKKLALIFRDGTTKTRAMNYLGWRFMQKFSRHTTQKYRDSHRDFQENVLGQLRLDDWMRCMFDVAEAMPMAIGRVYVERQGFEASDYRVYGMMLSLLEGLRHMLAEFKWLQSQSREKVSVILSKASMTIGYPAWLMNDSALNAYYADVPTSGSYVEIIAKALRANYANLLTTSVTLEVPSKLANFIFPSRFVELHHRSGPPRESLLYDIRSNHFVVPSGVLTPPYYVSDTTWSMNFGGLGVLVARDLVNEFLHAVDAGWMAESDRSEFKKSSDCVLTEVGKSSRSGSADDAVMRCGGLVSDLLALRLAYTAYHTHADSRDEPTVPGMEDKSPDQVFFMAAFRTLCTQLRERYYVPVVRGKEKVAELQYLDALMRSMNEFTDAFKCPDGKFRQNVVGRCLAGEAASAAAAKFKSRKRALWNPFNASRTSSESPVATTPRKTVYKRRNNRTVLKRPLDRSAIT